MLSNLIIIHTWYYQLFSSRKCSWGMYSSANIASSTFFSSTLLSRYRRVPARSRVVLCPGWQSADRRFYYNTRYAVKYYQLGAFLASTEAHWSYNWPIIYHALNQDASPGVGGVGNALRVICVEFRPYGVHVVKVKIIYKRAPMQWISEKFLINTWQWECIESNLHGYQSI